MRLGESGVGRLADGPPLGEVPNAAAASADLTSLRLRRPNPMQTPTRRITRASSKLTPIETAPDAELKAAVVAHQDEG